MTPVMPAVKIALWPKFSSARLDCRRPRQTCARHAGDRADLGLERGGLEALQARVVAPRLERLVVKVLRHAVTSQPRCSAVADATLTVSKLMSESTARLDAWFSIRCICLRNLVLRRVRQPRL
jgi:hypothetical protein